MRLAREAAEAEVSQKNKELAAVSRKLAKYLSPQVYNSIFTGAQSVEIASNRKKLTVFFSHIADFTGTTEKLESEELTQLLNRCLTEMARIGLELAPPSINTSAMRCSPSLATPSRKVPSKMRAPACAWRSRCSDACASYSGRWQELGAEKPFQVRTPILEGARQTQSELLVPVPYLPIPSDGWPCVEL